MRCADQVRAWHWASDGFFRTSLRGATRRSNPAARLPALDCFSL